MTGLLLQDFKNLSNNKLVHVLLNERQKMFGEPESQLNITKDGRLFLNSLACLIIKITKTRRKEC
jgi:hypothetical protein